MSEIRIHEATTDTRSDEREQLARYLPQLEALARAQGLDFHPVQFELVPSAFMMEVAIYGLPVRMPHWSFGVRYIYQYVQHRMGDSRIFEVVFPGNPNRAYLEARNALAENTLVCAHVLGHSDFSRHNLLFRRMQQELGYNIVETAAKRAQQIDEAAQRHGQPRVEEVLDAALALEQCIDLAQALQRAPYPEWETHAPAEERRGFDARYASLPGEAAPAAGAQRPTHSPIPPHPESDLLWFIAHYAPDLEGWERDIFLAVREESYYFHPLFACQIMNEGWASYWHARLLREADFLPQALYLDAIKSHSDVVRPYAGEDGVALRVNPYHVGFVMWEHIIERHGLDAAMRIREEEDDFSFVRNHLTEDLARELRLFAYTRHGHEPTHHRYIIDKAELHDIQEALLAPKYNYGAPRVYATHIGRDGSLKLLHDAATDGRGLDTERAEKVLDYIQRIWRRPVRLETVDADGDARVLGAG